MFRFIGVLVMFAAAMSAASLEIKVGEATVLPSITTEVKLPDGSVAIVYAPLTDNETFEISSLFASFKEDPFIDYGFAVKNFTGAPLSFLFVFSTPYMGGPYSVLSSSHSSSVTDGGNGTVTVATDTKAAIHTPSLDAADVLGGALGVGCMPAGAPGFSAGCEAPAGVVGLPIVSLAAGTLAITVSFTLSPGDIYTGNGRVEIGNAVIPEPGTYALALAGFGALFLVHRRRAR